MKRPVEGLSDAELLGELQQAGIAPPPDLTAVAHWIATTFPKGDAELKLFDIGHNVPVASFSATRRHGVKVSVVDQDLTRAVVKAAVQLARARQQ